ncbi:MAG: 4'-phosphopantetheinyl transferase superfamily protein [Candidatus Brocadiia bacterium]|jgi:4'-phosphopantetheinyl transferase
MSDTSSQYQWTPPPDNPVPDESEVHVWRASLRREASKIPSLLQLLSEDERSKAARFSLQEVREQFIVGRAILRGILGRYLHVEPERVQFNYGPHGKPAVAPECGGEGISFNMSDSYGLAIFAVARRRQVGIDLERVRSDVPCERMAKRFFAEAELKAFLALPADQRQKGFFNCWTRKEAYLKAIGIGLSFPLKNVAVSLAPCEPAAILAIQGDPGQAGQWSLTALHPDPAYSAALAAEGRECRLRFWQWDRY